MNEEFVKFIKLMNQHESSIYKWVYAKEIDYSLDPRDDENGTE